MTISSNIWDDIQTRFNELNEQLASSTIESSKRHLVQKELSYLTTLLSKHKEILKLEADYKEAQEQSVNNKDKELALLFGEEVSQIESQLQKANQELDKIMYPPNELDNRSAFLEIRAGTGGLEASLFAADLLKMYTNYALKRNWKVALISSSQTDLKGYREVVLHIEGKDVYGRLKYESGVHRVQRVPSTETSGRIHTSTATVAVLPEAEEVDVSINPSDLRIDVYRSSGAGGQHVNTTDSAVRITHIPTNVVVTCQDERSQHKNKAKALKMLQSRLLVAQREKQDQELSQKRKDLIGGATRSEKVRTYNYPQNRITDHQVDLTLNKLDIIMNGDLDDIVNALMKKEEEDRRKQPLSFIKT